MTQSPSLTHGKDSSGMMYPTVLDSEFEHFAPLYLYDDPHMCVAYSVAIRQTGLILQILISTSPGARAERRMVI